MSSFAGSDVFCQSGITPSATAAKWLAGPVNVHGVYVIPAGSDIGGLQRINLYDGDPGSGGTILFQLPCTYSPSHEMQGARYVEIPMNGVRFEEGVWLKVEGNTDDTPNAVMIFYTGSFQTIGTSPS
mgnify:CR=1 FL=1